MTPKRIVYQALGGLQDIGWCNSHLVTYNGAGTVFDAGWGNPRHGEEIDQEKHFPDFSPIFNNGSHLEEVVVSHPHFDHFNGMGLLVELLVRNYGKRLPTVRASIHMDKVFGLATFGINEQEDEDRIFAVREVIRRQTQLALPGRKEQTLSGANLYFHEIPHSVYGSMGTILEMNGTRIIYPGDFKLYGYSDHQTDNFKRVLRDVWRRDRVDGEKDVLLLDATGAEREGSSPSDKVALNAVLNEIRRNKGVRRTYIPQFGSHHRANRLILEINKEDPERQVLAKGRTMVNHLNLNPANNGKWDRFTNYEFEDGNGVVENDAVIFLTGSQYEEFSATWAFVADDVPDYLRPSSLLPRPGDALIYAASTIPKWDNESRVREMLTLWAEELKCTLHLPPGNVYDPEGESDHVVIGPYHTSGHAARDDLRKVIEIAQPSVVIPIHAGPGHRRLIQELCPPNIPVLLPEEGEEVIL